MSRDLRTLTLEERHALAIEAERRARAGEAPGEIRAALGLSNATYARWAKLFGFRQSDLHAQATRRGAPVSHPPGPGGYAQSGRMLRGLPPTDADGRRVSGPDHPAWRGGREATVVRQTAGRTSERVAYRDEIETLGSARAVLEAIESAMGTGDRARADGLLIAWKHITRRARDLETLRAAAVAEEEAAAAQAADALSDAALATDLERVTGRSFIIIEGEAAEDGGREA